MTIEEFIASIAEAVKRGNEKEAIRLASAFRDQYPEEFDEVKRRLSGAAD